MCCLGVLGMVWCVSEYVHQAWDTSVRFDVASWMFLASDFYFWKCGFGKGSRTDCLNNLGLLDYDIVLSGSKHHARFFIYKQLRMPMNICGKCNGSGCTVHRLGCVENWKPYTPQSWTNGTWSDDTFQKGISFFSGGQLSLKGCTTHLPCTILRRWWM